MLKPEFVFLCLIIAFFGPGVQFCRADLGTASQYASQHTPTACYGSDPSQYPRTGYFAAAGEAIWDNGNACGRQYLVQCISTDLPLGCVSGQTIQVRIVDRARTSISRPAVEGAGLVLYATAFTVIADPAIPIINIQYQQ